MAIQTQQQFIEFIKRKLGWPFVNIEVSGEQFNDCVNEAMQMFTEHAEMGVVEKVYLLATETKAHEYVISGDVVAVTQVLGPAAGTTSDFLFSLENQLIQDGILRPEMMTKSGGVTQLVILKQYIQTLTMMLTKGIVFDYNPVNKKLTLLETPPWNRLFLVCYEKLDPATSPGLYDQRWVKNYATAKAKLQWGNNLAKFTMSLPGQATLNAQDIIASAQTEIEKLELELQDVYAAPADFFVG